MTGILNALIAGVSGAVKDTYFNLVSLLLPGNGTNGAQNNTFLDSSSNNFTITRNGDTTQGTFSPFSQTGWGNYFNGVTGTALSIPYSSNYANFGTGDFTIECWVYQIAQVQYSAIMSSQKVSEPSGGWILGNNNSDLLSFYVSGTFYLATDFTSYFNRWTHVAVVRQSGTLRLYINGVQQTTASVGGSITGDTTNPAIIGRRWTDNTAYVFNGYISNLRIVNGTCLYNNGTTFTPSTSPLTAISGTQLLTCQTNRFKDNSSNNATITAAGSVAVTPFSPFAPTSSYSAAAVGGSGYFDGSGDYLSVANSSLYRIEVNTTWTIECWVYALSLASTPVLLANTTNGSSTGHLFYLNAGVPTVIQYGNASFASTATINANAWNHIAVVCNSNSGTFYVNGSSAGTFTWGSGSAGGALFVGAAFTGSNTLNGYVSGVRYVVGSTAVPSGIPTAPPTAITNTQLLLNFTNAGIYDATAKNVLETEGNAQISTSVSKWPGGSISLPQVSTTDYLRDPSTFIFSGDFVIEGWIYFSSSSTGFPSLFSSTTASQLQLQFNSTGATYYFSFAGSAIINAQASGLSADTWTHFAIVRSGTAANNISVYFGGTRKNQATSTATVTQALVIGVDHAFVNPFKGYIDDFRITVGTTRGYSGASITVPTAPFPLQ